ncbi:hypothetical protein FOZ63_005841 [Perkinsus olseni]|uniref:Uncharacterized protein n=1 Tax=Perkinsus olseni TaxID=32597 RepID=A0A7J6QD03_PEROL|nr:hypothetical protein FOZ63_005841 [Perkinsus olseni]
MMNILTLLAAVVATQEVSAKLSGVSFLELSESPFTADNTDRDAVEVAKTLEGLNLDEDEDSEEDIPSGEAMLGESGSAHIHYYVCIFYLSCRLAL